MNSCVMAAAAVLLATAAQAGGDHRHGEGHSAGTLHQGLSLGVPAPADGPAREVTVTMRETEDGAMVFEPASLDFRGGETVRLVIRNAGAQEHEFVMDSPEGIGDHKAMMAEMPDMMHQEANALRLAPGGSGQIVWTFGEPGRYEFACLLPGHYEAGMHGPLVVQ